VLHEQDQLLLVSAMMSISDAGELLPQAWRQWFLLMPFPDGPAFLLRSIACREQLLLPQVRTHPKHVLIDHMMQQKELMLAPFYISVCFLFFLFISSVCSVFCLSSMGHRYVLVMKLFSNVKTTFP